MKELRPKRSLNLLRLLGKWVLQRNDGPHVGPGMLHPGTVRDLKSSNPETRGAAEAEAFNQLRSQ